MTNYYSWIVNYIFDCNSLILLSSQLFHQSNFKLKKSLNFFNLTCTIKKKNFRSYMKSFNNTSECIPFCKNKCIEGKCIAPGTCGCNIGFVPYVKDSHVCIPYCKSKCVNGDCVAPDKCRCRPGYEYLSSNETSVCVPKCTPKCINAKCVAPDICHCEKGYLQHLKLVRAKFYFI